MMAQTCPTTSIPSDQFDLRECTPPLRICASSNISISSVVLETNDLCTPCAPGDVFAVDVIVTINNSTSQTNSFAVFADLSDGITTCEYISCAGPILAMADTPLGDGNQEINLGTISYLCGDDLVLSNLNIVVGADGNLCPLECVPAMTNCFFTIPEIPLAQPLLNTPCESTMFVACDDGDSCTENDMEEVDACDGVTVCLPCTGTPIASCTLPSIAQACDDGDPCTENDIEEIDDCDGITV